MGFKYPNGTRIILLTPSIKHEKLDLLYFLRKKGIIIEVFYLGKHKDQYYNYENINFYNINIDERDIKYE
jgi:hypothetical protein